VDPSSDPGRDEYGLPPVDIEVPDDARDLARDVQAYHREMKALRRRARITRLARPLGRRGMLIPLIAGCLALTLLSGTLLTVLAGRQANPAPGKTSAAASRTPSPTSSGLLPDAQVTLDGKQISLHALVPAVLAWVPQSCACLAALKQLTRQVTQAHVPMYLVGTDRVVPGLSSLARQVGQSASRVVSDTHNVLGVTYSPVGLTAILANGDGQVGDVVKELQPSDERVVAKLPALALPAQRASSPAPSQATPQPS
jgi:hypothetical protein